MGKATLYTTGEILAEIEEVITRSKFNEVMKRAHLTSDLITPKPHVKICRDEKDNKFLECAEHAKADYLVSGDEDLLSLNEYKEIPIVKAWKILQLLA